MDKEVSKYTLPEGWALTTIPELCIIVGGGTPSKNNRSYWNGDINWASVKDIKSQYLSATIDKITRDGILSSSTNIASIGDVILVTRISPGQVTIAKKETAINQDLKILKLFGGINPSFIYYLLKAQEKQFILNSSGTTVKGLRVNDLSNIKLPLPPFNEQNRIVSKIEELFSELDHAVVGLKKAQKQLEIYRQGLLKNAFDGKLTENWRVQNQNIPAFEALTKIKNNRKVKYLENIKNKTSRKPKIDFEFEFSQNDEIRTWAEASLDNLIEINARIGWRGLKKDEYTKEGPLFLSVHALNFGKSVVFKDANHVSIKRYEESPEIKLEINDILLCKDGAGIGKIAMIKHLPDRATVNSSLLVIKVKEVFIPDYFYYFLLGPEMQKLVYERISGSAIPHLFQKDIRKFKLKVPPIEEQKQIIQELESRFTLIENLENSINVGLRKTEAFRHSILKEAFEGKLVPQDSNDESATQLLKQIQKEKAIYLNSQKEIVKLKPKYNRAMENYKKILELLKEKGEPISAKELWQLSIYKDNIDAFYAQLKEHLEKGEIVEIERCGKESYLKLTDSK